MIPTPPRDANNRFSCLSVDHNDNTFESTKDVRPPDPLPTPAPPKRSDILPRPRWERNRVPRAFVISSLTPKERASLDLDIELKTTDTGREFKTRALVDSGATGSFIDRDYVRRCGIQTRKL